MLQYDNLDNIVFIATYEDLAKKSEEVMLDLKINGLIVHSKSLQHSLDYVRDGLNRGTIDAVITRGGTALKLREEFNIPVIEIQVTIFDILKAIEKAKAFGNKIGVIGFPNIISNISSLSNFMQVEIVEIKISNINDCTNAVRKASELEVEVIVGDRIAVETANRYGIRGEFIESDSYECISEAFYKAMEIADVRRKQLAKAEELKAITELTQSGIIAIDKDGKITLFNAEASKILDIKSECAIDNQVNELIPELNLYDILDKGHKKLDEILCIDNKWLVMHKIPIMIKEKVLGAVVTFQKLDKIQHIEKKAVNKLRERGHVAKFNFESMIGKSPVIQSVIDKAKNYSLVDSVILLNGETGTGKEVFAQSIHNHSLRKNGPFVGVNCASLPYSLLESELFGYVKGAFTGASGDGKIGLFEQAHGGTIFLDEIGEIPISVQARLLRVLQEGQIQKIGDDKIISVNVRIISATNKNLKELVKLNKFREDLFYRINVLNIKLPSLKERVTDIPLFIEFFVSALAKEYNKTIIKVDNKLILKLCNYSYPGNIRQLENIVERLVVENKDGVIKIEDLPKVLDDDLIEDDELLSINSITKKTIENALKLSNNNKTAAAKILGIDRSTLWRKIKTLG